jgi:hypothetical protein
LQEPVADDAWHRPSTGSLPSQCKRETAMADDNKNEKPDLGLPELPDELKDIPELQDLQNQSKKPDQPNKPDPEEERKNRTRMLVGSQFAYTLVIASFVFGYIGHWLGSLLGGGLWSVSLMILLGGVGFVVEMWRMINFFSDKPKKPKDDDKSPKQ